MKILQITASYKPAYIYGGPIYSVAALCEALVNDGGSLVDELCATTPLSMTKESITKFDLQVITTLANGKIELPYQSGKQQMVEGVPVRYFKRWTKDHSHFSPALLFWLWKNAKNYEVIHIHAWWNLVSMGAVCICLLRGIKPIVSPRGMLGEYTFSKGKRVFHQLLGKRLLSACDFHATTLMEAKEIASELSGDHSKIDMVDFEKFEIGSTGSEVRDRQIEVGSQQAKSKIIRIYIIHNIVNFPTVLPQKTRVFDGTLKLIFLSRIHPKKGIELLLDALATFSFPFSLSIVGEGEEGYVESLKRKVESGKLKDAVNWIGAVYGDDKFKLLAEHDLLVLPSYNENFANVVIESLAVNTPVLVSEMVGLSSWVLQHDGGWVCKNDPFNIAAKLKESYELNSLGHKLPLNNKNTHKNTTLYFYAYERI
jgi:glycosyltransferase involved in cell wall biosynthesis